MGSPGAACPARSAALSPPRSRDPHAMMPGSPLPRTSRSEKNPSPADAQIERVERARARSAQAGLAAAARALGRIGSGTNRGTGLVLRARLLRVQAHALRGLGRHAEASRDYRAATDLFEAAGLPLESARCAIGWVDALMYLGRYSQARRTAASALPRFVRAGERSAAARLLNNVANLEYRLDRPRQALALYTRARRGLKAAGGANRAVLARVDANRANCLALGGRPGDAARLLRHAGNAFQQSGRALEAAGCDYALAYLLFLQHRYAEALFALAALEPRFAGLGAEDYRVLLDADASEIHLRLGRPSDAATAAARAAARAGELGMRYERAKSQYFEGVAHAARGEYSGARGCLANARRGFVRENNQVWIGQCELARAECDLAQHRGARALRGARLAAARFERAGDRVRAGLAWVLAGRAALALGRPTARLIARAAERARRADATFLAFRVACLEGDAAVAAQDLGRARRAYARAMRISESLAGRVQGELFRATDWTAWEDAYPGMVALELAAGRPAGVFRALERARARAFERFDPGTPGALTHGRFPPQLEARLRALACRLEVRSFGRSPRAAVPEPFVAPQQQERREVARLLDKVEREALGRRGRHAPAPPTLAAARAVLGPHELVLEYFVLPGRVGVFALDANGCAVHEWLLSPTALETALDEIRYLARGAAGRLPGAGPALEQALAELGRVLLAEPLRAARERGVEPAHLVVVPSGPLVTLPWSSLAPAMVSVLPSVAFLQAGRVRPARRPASAASTHRLGPGPVVLVGLGDEHMPAVEREIGHLAQLLPGARVLLGRDATAARVRAAVAGADWLHLSGHGRHDGDRPVLSGVRLADRWAYLPDLAPGGHAPRTVVLAACRTGELVGGFRNDWQGLAGGLLRANTRTVLASLWDADDGATFALSAAIYERLIRGEALGEALAGARADAPADPATHWSANAWTLLGDAEARLSIPGARAALRLPGVGRSMVES